MGIRGCRSHHITGQAAHGCAFEERCYELGGNRRNCEQILGGAAVRAGAGRDYLVVPAAGKARAGKRQGPEGVSPRDGGAFARPVLRGLQAAHARGILSDPRPGSDAGHVRAVSRAGRQRRNPAFDGGAGGVTDLLRWKE